MNEDCPTNNIITTENECRQAAAQQTGAFKGGVAYRYNRPAGCYRHHGKTIFSSNINPSSTNPTDNSAGLCKEGSIFS